MESPKTEIIMDVFIATLGVMCLALLYQGGPEIKDLKDFLIGFFASLYVVVTAVARILRNIDRMDGYTPWLWCEKCQDHYKKSDGCDYKNITHS